MSSGATNRLLLLAAAFLFSTGGAAIKATALTSWQVASFRSGIAALALWALLPGARRGWSRRAVLVGFAYAATLVLFVLANRLTTAANAIFLQSTGPLYVLLLGPWLLREPVRRSDVAFGSAVALGLALFFAGREAAVATAPDPFTGNVLGACTGLSWGLTITGLRWLGRQGASGGAAIATVAAGNLIAAVAALPMALPVSSARPSDLLLLLYLGVFQIGLAYFCLTRAIRQVPAFEAATLLLLEPALNPVWAWLVHGERPAAPALAGGLLIVGSTFVNTWWQGRSRGAVEMAECRVSGPRA